jgi:hypothetical protein
MCDLTDQQILAAVEAAVPRARQRLEEVQLAFLDGRLCGAAYGSNPDLCYLDDGHPEPFHTNVYGCTWPVTPGSA